MTLPSFARLPLASATATSAIRPLMTAGPIDRKTSDRTRIESAGAVCCWAATGDACAAAYPTQANAATVKRAVLRSIQMLGAGEAEGGMRGWPRERPGRGTQARANRLP